MNTEILIAKTHNNKQRKNNNKTRTEDVNRPQKRGKIATIIIHNKKTNHDNTTASSTAKINNIDTSKT
jgi:hypothetical protein